jgi:hypothetical protein
MINPSPMTRLIPFLLLVLYTCGNSRSAGKLTKLPEDELVRRIQNNQLPPPETVTLKNEAGEIISLETLRSLERQGGYFEDFYVNKDGEIVEIVIRKATDADRRLLARLHKDRNDDWKVRPVEVDCSDQANVLQKVLEADQGIRKGETGRGPDTDLRNLEIVVSLIEQCCRICCPAQKRSAFRSEILRPFLTIE